MIQDRGDNREYERMQYLIDVLNRNSKLYYTRDGEGCITDYEFDKLLDELSRLEDILGVVLPDSPSRHIGWVELKSDKAPHIRPILSLKSTKSIDELLYFVGEREAVMSWKLDGLSLVLYYSGGKLVNALTRGDGHMGKVIFDKALLMPSIPKEIPTKEDLVVRGEGCISLDEFEAIKRTKSGEQFSNPRNLAAGIINTVARSSILLRHLTFIAHSTVSSTGFQSPIEFTVASELRYLADLGFNVVPHSVIHNFQLKHEVERYTESIANFEYPVDGLVLSLNDIPYRESLGETARFPRGSLAFKWPDEIGTTAVRGMKWSVSRTGLITPVVILEPIDLDGTIVRQANLHSLKGFEDLAIGKGDILEVYKANKIIPEVSSNLTRSGTEPTPHICPRCGGPTRIAESIRTRKLYCDSCKE